MSLPIGFLELADPPWVDGGRPVGNLDRSPASPIFYRGALRTFGGPPQLGLGRPPRWVITGGPVPLAQFDQVARMVSDWALQQSQQGQSFFVDSEAAFIAPDGLFDSRWPRRNFEWSWVYEPNPPSLYQLQTRDFATGNPRGNWIRVR